jgi:geranylgeranyl pyrophosphate synthase
MKYTIEEFLAERKPLVDKAIEKYIPRKYDEAGLEETSGKPAFEYDEKALSEAVAKPIWDLLDRGGKRWRPALLLLVCEAFGGDWRKALDFSVIVEVVHNGTLMVDDIEDDSELRRGKPCIHKIYGIDVAVNAGNAMYFLPLLVLFKNKKNYSSETLQRVYEIYGQEMINVSFGQATDIWWHKGGNESVTEEQYLQMVAFKTSCLARMAAKIGAVLAGAGDNEVNAVGKYAESFAIAFQIQDDILNLVGEKEYGKEIGGDISEGKRTLMVVHCLKHASKEDAIELKRILKMHTKDPSLIKKAISTIKKTGSIEYARSFAKKIVEDSWKAGEKFLPESEAKHYLQAFANYLVDRKV